MSKLESSTLAGAIRLVETEFGPIRLYPTGPGYYLAHPEGNPTHSIIIAPAESGFIAMWKEAK